MPDFKLLGLAALLLSCAGVGFAQHNDKPEKPDPSCPQYSVVQAFKQVVVANQGSIEPIHIAGGLAVLATAKTKPQAAAIQSAADTYLRDMRTIAASKAANGGKSGSCWVVLKGLSEGKVKEDVTVTSEGVLITLITSDAALIAALHKGNCCQYCICPSTVTRCSGCC